MEYFSSSVPCLLCPICWHAGILSRAQTDASESQDDLLVPLKPFSVILTHGLLLTDAFAAMVPRSRHNRASSVPSSPTRPFTTGSGLTTTTSNTDSPSYHNYNTDDRSSFSSSSPTSKRHGSDPNGSPTSSTSSHGHRKASFLQPRVAVALNVPSPWHPWLFALRLCSILPAVWWGTPSLLQLLLRILEILLKRKNGGSSSVGEAAASLVGGGGYYHATDDIDVPLTETTLAAIWCFASGYLSFFFTDCLMSRWCASSLHGPSRDNTELTSWFNTG